jgi:hypothetical protein
MAQLCLVVKSITLQAATARSVASGHRTMQSKEHAPTPKPLPATPVRWAIRATAPSRICTSMRNARARLRRRSRANRSGCALTAGSWCAAIVCGDVRVMPSDSVVTASRTEPARRLRRQCDQHWSHATAHFACLSSPLPILGITSVTALLQVNIPSRFRQMTTNVTATRIHVSQGCASGQNGLINCQ